MVGPRLALAFVLAGCGNSTPFTTQSEAGTSGSASVGATGAASGSSGASTTGVGGAGVSAGTIAGAGAVTSSGAGTSTGAGTGASAGASSGIAASGTSGSTGSRTSSGGQSTSGASSTGSIGSGTSGSSVSGSASGSGSGGGSGSNNPSCPKTYQPDAGACPTSAGCRYPEGFCDCESSHCGGALLADASVAERWTCGVLPSSCPEAYEPDAGGPCTPETKCSYGYCCKPTLVCSSAGKWTQSIGFCPP